MNQEKVGAFIKKLRLKNNLSQQKFAEKLGVTSQAVSKWENGKNIPDLAIMLEISKLFNVEIDEIIKGEFNNSLRTIKKDKKKNIIIIILIIIIIILLSLLIILSFKKSDNYNFDTLSTNCKNFNLSGTISYNTKKSSIYISNIEYCGKKDETKYKKIKCFLYEENDNVKTTIGAVNSLENITLDEFLQNVEFSIENYSHVCKDYKKNDLYLEINAMTENEKNIMYKIPLTLSENCKK